MNKRKRKQKQMDRMLVNLVQSVCISFGILILVKMLTSPTAIELIILLGSMICCTIGFYDARRIVEEMKEWEKWMDRGRSLVSKIIVLALSYVARIQEASEQPSTRMMKRKMKKFNFSFFRN